MGLVGMAPAGALAAEQSHPLPRLDASPQLGASPVLLAALEQEPSVDTLQPKDTSAEAEAEAAGAVALQTAPASLCPYWRAGPGRDPTQGVLQPAGVLMPPTAEVPLLVMPFVNAARSYICWR